jgi:sugar phosphate permease
MRAGTKIITALWALQIANYMDRTAMAFAGPTIMSSLGLGPQSLGLILSAFSIGYALAQIPGGWIADRWSVRGLLALSALLWAAITGLTGIMTVALAFIAVRLALGAAEGIANSGLFRAIGDNFPPRARTGVIAVLGTAPALGQAAAAPLIGFIIAAQGWPSVFLWLMVPPILASALAFRYLPSRRTFESASGDELGAAAPSRAGILRLLQMPSLRIIAVINIGFSIAFWGFNGWMPSYLSTARHLDVRHVGFYGSLPYVASFASVILFGYLGTRLHTKRPQLVAFCYVAAAASLYAAFDSETLGGAIAGLCGTSFFLHGSISSVGSLMLDFAPSADRALFVGIAHTSGQVGGIVAPALIGFLVARTSSFAPGFAFMEVALLVAAVGAIILLRQTPGDPETAFN